MASSAAQYQLFGVHRSNWKYDVISFLIVAGLIALLVVVLFTDFHLVWLQEQEELNSSEESMAGK